MTIIEKTVAYQQIAFSAFKITAMRPLWKSCKLGKVAEVREALARGEDVNGKDKDNQTGLMWAAENKHNSIVRLLLEQPTLDLNCTDVIGVTALHKAAKYDFHTALQRAEYWDNSEAVRLLLADPRLSTANHKSKHGHTPAMRAIFSKNVNALRELVTHPSVDLDIGTNLSLEDLARWDFQQ